MRHRKLSKHLNRTGTHQAAMMRNLCIALFIRGSIRTTLPKAKALRRFAERLITLSKQDTVARRRLVFARLPDKAVVAKLFTQIAILYKDRPGGYTQVLKCGYRTGDASPMAIIQLVRKETASISGSESDSDSDVA